MKYTKTVLLVPLFLVLLVVACSPTTESPTIPQAGDVSVATYHDMEVRYVVREEVIFNDVEIDVWNEWLEDEGYCIVEIDDGWVENVSPGDVAGYIAYCFNAGPLNFKYETPEEGRAFEEAYAAAYLRKCGNHYPKGWFASSSECVVPRPSDVKP